MNKEIYTLWKYAIPSNVLLIVRQFYYTFRMFMSISNFKQRHRLFEIGCVNRNMWIARGNRAELITVETSKLNFDLAPIYQRTFLLRDRWLTVS